MNANPLVISGVCIFSLFFISCLSIFLLYPYGWLISLHVLKCCFIFFCCCSDLTAGWCCFFVCLSLVMIVSVTTCCCCVVVVCSATSVCLSFCLYFHLSCIYVCFIFFSFVFTPSFHIFYFISFFPFEFFSRPAGVLTP